MKNYSMLSVFNLNLISILDNLCIYLLIFIYGYAKTSTRR